MCSGLRGCFTASTRRAYGEQHVSGPCSPCARVAEGASPARNPHTNGRNARFRPAAPGAQNGLSNPRQPPFLSLWAPRKPRNLSSVEAVVEGSGPHPLRGAWGGVRSSSLGSAAGFSSRVFATKTSEAQVFRIFRHKRSGETRDPLPHRIRIPHRFYDELLPSLSGGDLRRKEILPSGAHLPPTRALREARRSPPALPSSRRRHGVSRADARGSPALFLRVAKL